MTRFLNTALYHALAYNGVWLATVYGIHSQRPILGIAIAGLYIGIHLLHVILGKPVQKWGLETVWILLFGLLGAVVEGLQQRSLFITYPHGLYPLIPLWMSFSLCIKYAFTVFEKHPIALGLFSAIGAPFSYYSAAKIADLSIAPAGPLWICIAVGWGIGIPLLQKMSRWWPQ